MSSNGLKQPLAVILKFGLLAAALMLLMLISQYSFATISYKTELKITVFAILFIFFGYVLNQLIFREKNIQQAGPFIMNKKKLWDLGISNREFEVLQLLAEGKSNLETGEQLFISESTVKTHVSNLLIKLNAKRRTEAITIARQFQLIP